MSLLGLRVRKLIYALTEPASWRGLRWGTLPSIEHRRLLASLAHDLVIDVGANRGQFSLMTRLLRPWLPIQAFEPLATEAAVFQHVLGSQPGITLHECALGEIEGEAELHVSGRADSSSLLPIGELQARLFPATREIGTRRVRVVPLDSLPEVWSAANRALLKIDVQGFELSVLRGARRALRHCAYVYAECSHVPLYTGQALHAEVEAFLNAEGFQALRRANEQVVDGRLVQADYLFARAAGKHGKAGR